MLKTHGINNLKIGAKLLMILILPLLALIATSYISIKFIDGRVAQLITYLHEKAFVGSALILNADRDLYQAVLVFLKNPGRLAVIPQSIHLLGMRPAAYEPCQRL